MALADADDGLAVKNSIEGSKTDAGALLLGTPAEVGVSDAEVRNRGDANVCSAGAIV
jgi:hypothetical protein